MSPDAPARIRVAVVDDQQVVRAAGIRQVRVRHHDKLARIEVDPADFATLLAQRESIVPALRALVRSEIARWTPIIEAANVRAE